MGQLRVAKADQEDFETTRAFLQACEQFWDSRPRYSFKSPANSWDEWDDDDEDKIALLKIRKAVAEEEGIEECEVDNRIILYEFLNKKYRKADCNWGRVVMAADILIDNCCDPTESHLAYSPYLEERHVAPEQ